MTSRNKINLHTFCNVISILVALCPSILFFFVCLDYPGRFEQMIDYISCPACCVPCCICSSRFSSAPDDGICGSSYYHYENITCTIMEKEENNICTDLFKPSTDLSDLASSCDWGHFTASKWVVSDCGEESIIQTRRFRLLLPIFGFVSIFTHIIRTVLLLIKHICIDMDTHKTVVFLNRCHQMAMPFYYVGFLVVKFFFEELSSPIKAFCPGPFVTIALYFQYILQFSIGGYCCVVFGFVLALPLLRCSKFLSLAVNNVSFLLVSLFLAVLLWTSIIFVKDVEKMLLISFRPFRFSMSAGVLLFCLNLAMLVDLILKPVFVIESIIHGCRGAKDGAVYIASDSNQEMT